MRSTTCSTGGAVLAADDAAARAAARSRAAGGGTLDAARDRRHRLGRQDLDQGADRRADRARTARSRPIRANFNTEIGLPLAILAAPRGHRGARARDGHARVRRRSPSWRAIAEPDVGVITNIGPVHLEQVGLAGGRRARPRRSCSRHRAGAPRSSPPTSRCSSRGCATTSRSSPSARAATSSRARSSRRRARRLPPHVVIAHGERRRARAAVRPRATTCVERCSRRWPPRGRSA